MRMASAQRHRNDYQPLAESEGGNNYESFPRPRVESSFSEEDGLRADLFAPAPSDHEATVEQRARAPTASTRRWDHMENLDEFFRRVYEYQQRGGFGCIALWEASGLAQFVFVVAFSAFLLECVDYGVLFRDKPSPAGKRTVGDALVPHCAAQLSPLVVACLLLAVVFWLLRLVRLLYQMLQFWDIRNFYLNALRISSADLVSMTWHDVMQRLCEVQVEQQIAIDRKDLTALDVCQRVLRYKNYTVAMVNRGLLPARVRVPLLGPVAYLSNGFKLNLELLLFWRCWQDYFSLRPEFKQRQRRAELVARLERDVLCLGLANLVLAPLVFVWQILYSFFSYAELVKREPGALGSRRWSNYARYYFRHLNELDHELKMRLNRGYRPASQYMELFISRPVEIVAKNVAFVAAAFFAVLAILSAWDEDVLAVEHVLTAMTVCGLVVFGCKAFIADENLVWCPEWLMNLVVAHVHYVPDSWRGQAHSERVRTEMGQFLQLKVYYLLEELLSPLITPLLLLFWVRPRAARFVDFYQKFTVDVAGLGDVCSFAQMDVRKHGEPAWAPTGGEGRAAAPADDAALVAERGAQTRHGKTEMSLLHFAVTNPDWRPPQPSARFLERVRQHMEQDAARVRDCEATLADNALLHSLTALAPPSLLAGPLAAAGRLVGGGVTRAEGPLRPAADTSLLASLHQSTLLAPPLLASSLASSGAAAAAGGALAECAATEMSVHALYLRELHQRRLRGANYGSATAIQMQSVAPLPLVSQLWAVPEQHARTDENEDADDDSPPQLFSSR